MLGRGRVYGSLLKQKKVSQKNVNKLYKKPFPDDLPAFTFNY